MWQLAYTLSVCCYVSLYSAGCPAKASIVCRKRPLPKTCADLDALCGRKEFLQRFLKKKDEIPYLLFNSWHENCVVIQQVRLIALSKKY